MSPGQHVVSASSRGLLASGSRSAVRSSLAARPLHTSSRNLRPAVTTTTTTTGPTISVTSTPVSSKSVEKIFTHGRSKIALASSDYRKQPLTMARHLLQWSWYAADSAKHKQLSLLASVHRDSSEAPDWLARDYVEARAYRTARSRLWRPTQAELEAYGISGRVDAWIAKQLAEVGNAEGPGNLLEISLDSILKPVWLSLTEAQRSAALQRVKYECARRIGWRKGYSSGFPIATPEALTAEKNMLQEELDSTQEALAAEETREKSGSEQEEAAYAEALESRKEVLRERLEQLLELETKWQGRKDKLAAITPRARTSADAEDKVHAAFAELMASEEEAARKEWDALSPEEQTAELKAAWKLRDRSHIYMDDSPESTVLQSPLPRWLATPQRAGQLQFLPSLSVKLVRNHVPKGEEYDAWKATFRVPLDVHKHQLRSYLLAIYGLKTTWARSSIYRSSIGRNPLNGQKRRGSDRNYKKVEVGLLEPFIWPEVDPKFKTDRLMSEDLEFEKQRMYIKMSKARRWRSVRPVDPITTPDGKKQTPLIIARAKGIPTAKHSRILTLLRNQTLAKEQLIAAKAAELQKQAAATL